MRLDDADQGMRHLYDLEVGVGLGTGIETHHHAELGQKILELAKSHDLARVRAAVGSGALLLAISLTTVRPVEWLPDQKPTPCEHETTIQVQRDGGAPRQPPLLPAAPVSGS